MIAPLGGGRKNNETLLTCLWREVNEESLLTEKDIELDSKRPYNFILDSDEKASVGFWYLGQIVTPFLFEGHPLYNEEMCFIRVYSLEHIKFLISHPELVYKPEFNIPLLRFCDFVAFFESDANPYTKSTNLLATALALGVPRDVAEQYLYH